MFTLDLLMSTLDLPWARTVRGDVNMILPSILLSLNGCEVAYALLGIIVSM